MPTEYEFEKADRPSSAKHPTDWLVRELRDGKPWGHWRRLHRTPRGKYYLLNSKGERVEYGGPAPRPEEG